MLALKARLGVTIGATIGAALLAMAFVLPAGSAMASAGSCQQENGTGPLYTCVYVNGGGLHINDVQGSVYNTRSGNQTHVHIEITGPHGVIKNCVDSTIPSLGTIYCTWSPNANEVAGNYCVTAWQYVAGHYYNRGNVCVGVHA